MTISKDGPLDIRLSVRDKPAMRKSFDTVLGWDFDSLIIAHGHCVHSGAKEDVRRAFAWIMDG